MRYVKSGDSLATPKHSVLLYLDFYANNRKKKKKWLFHSQILFCPIRLLVRMITVRLFVYSVDLWYLYKKKSDGDILYDRLKTEK